MANEFEYGSVSTGDQLSTTGEDVSTTPTPVVPQEPPSTQDILPGTGTNDLGLEYGDVWVSSDTGTTDSVD